VLLGGVASPVSASKKYADPEELQRIASSGMRVRVVDVTSA
jgi:hypothetical protein